MNTKISFLKRHSLVLGIALIFLFTWPIGLSNAGVLPFKVPLVIAAFEGWGIIFAATIMTGLTLGKADVISLLKRYLKWRVNWKWYLVALLLGPILIVSSVYIHAALTGVQPDYSTIMIYKFLGRSISLRRMIVGWFIFEIVTNGEEIGWRGYILPRLQSKHSALISSLILGVIWGLWHLPNFMVDFDIVRFGWFMVQITAQAIILTWLYNSTGGSLLLTMLYHASGNTAGMFMPMADTISSANLGAYIIFVLLLVIVAMTIVMLTGSARLSTNEPVHVTKQVLENV